jgi:hypothetical protein
VNDRSFFDRVHFFLAHSCVGRVLPKATINRRKNAIASKPSTRDLKSADFKTERFVIRKTLVPIFRVGTVLVPLRGALEVNPKNDSRPLLRPRTARIYAVEAFLSVHRALLFHSSLPSFPSVQSASPYVAIRPGHPRLISNPCIQPVDLGIMKWAANARLRNSWLEAALRLT